MLDCDCGTGIKSDKKPLRRGLKRGVIAFHLLPNGRFGGDGKQFYLTL